MTNNKWQESLWTIYQRKAVAELWVSGGTFPWEEKLFGERMLREHLDESHGAASRVAGERQLQIDWIWEKLKLKEGAHLIDISCGPGLYAVPIAEKGCLVTGYDISPVSIEYAKRLAKERGVKKSVQFHEADLNYFRYRWPRFNAAIFLYGQLAVFPEKRGQTILNELFQMMKVGGRLLLEMLHPDHVDKEDSNWWYTDESGLWGERPFLHLGERFWNEAAQTSVERYQIIDLESGVLTQFQLCDRVYQRDELVGMLRKAGFQRIELYEGWDQIGLYDEDEWIVYIAEK